MLRPANSVFSMSTNNQAANMYMPEPVNPIPQLLIPDDKAVNPYSHNLRSIQQPGGNNMVPSGRRKKSSMADSSSHKSLIVQQAYHDGGPTLANRASASESALASLNMQSKILSLPLNLDGQSHQIKDQFDLINQLHTLSGDQ